MDAKPERKPLQLRRKRRQQANAATPESKTLSVRLPKALLQRLESRAEAVGESASKHLKRIVVAALQDEASARILHEVEAVRGLTERVSKSLKLSLLAILMTLDHAKSEAEHQADVDQLLGR